MRGELVLIMKKMYQYLVIFSCKKDGVLGACTVVSQIYRNKKIKSFNDINALTAYLTETNEGVSNVGITNFILLGRHKV